MANGSVMSHDSAGTPCLCICTVADSSGNPIPDVKIDIWETDSAGFYDVQHADRDGPDGRCVMKSDESGGFWYKAIKPVPCERCSQVLDPLTDSRSYPIPHDGPVGKLLEKLHRHPYRPAHMHFMFEKKGWDHLITYSLILLITLSLPITNANFFFDFS